MTNCKAEETSISWNIKGAPVRPDRKEIPGRRVCPVRKGPAGPQGAVGPSGALSTFDAIQGLPCTVGGVAGTISLTYGTTNQGTLKCLALAEPPPPVDPNQATVLLSEVAPNQPSGQDLIELRVASGGTLEGLVLVRGATVQTVIATLPAMTVQAGDVIVVHLNPAIEVMTELLSKSECFAPACYSTAWDVRAVIGTISSIDGVATVTGIVDQTMTNRGAAAFTNATSASTSFFDDVQYLQARGLWEPANCGGFPCTATSLPTIFDVTVNWSGVAPAFFTAARARLRPLTIPETYSRGATISPRGMRSRSATSHASWPPAPARTAKWTRVSIRPGIRNLPSPSIRLARSGTRTVPVSPIEAMRLWSTTTFDSAACVPPPRR